MHHTIFSTPGRKWPHAPMDRISSMHCAQQVTPLACSTLCSHLESTRWQLATSSGSCSKLQMCCNISGGTSATDVLLSPCRCRLPPKAILLCRPAIQVLHGQRQPLLLESHQQALYLTLSDALWSNCVRSSWTFISCQQGPPSSNCSRLLQSKSNC